MENLDSKYKLSSVKILHETKGCETLVINLESGSYFILENVASLIWQMLVRQITLAEIEKNISEKMSVNEDVCQKELKYFVESLVSENLIVSVQGEVASQEISAELLQLYTAYSKPEVRKFTDMEALLLADPIHEFK
ncbi:MAG: PqqD family protein [Proteobacteria bacterium]|nr:PqqD family protein [Pseudomonadota bacterium]